MTTYKELADYLDGLAHDLKILTCPESEDQVKVREAVAILRSLDAQRPTVDEVMELVDSFGICVYQEGLDDGTGKSANPIYGVEAEAKIRTEIEALAAPVAAQPTAESIYNAIKHGDTEHQAWLREALDSIFAGRPVAQQKTQASKPLSDADFAFNMLALMFDAYENGVPCYEDPEDEVGFIGYAYRLADDDFQNIANFLNRVRPVQSGIKERG